MMSTKTTVSESFIHLLIQYTRYLKKISICRYISAHKATVMIQGALPRYTYIYIKVKKSLAEKQILVSTCHFGLEHDRREAGGDAF